MVSCSKCFSVTRFPSQFCFWYSSTSVCVAVVHLLHCCRMFCRVNLPQFIYFLGDIHLSCFHLVALTHITALSSSTYICVSVSRIYSWLLNNMVWTVHIHFYVDCFSINTVVPSYLRFLEPPIVDWKQYFHIPNAVSQWRMKKFFSSRVGWIHRCKGPTVELKVMCWFSRAPLTPYIVKGSTVYLKVELPFKAFPDLKVMLNYFAKGLDSVIVPPTNV